MSFLDFWERGRSNDGGFFQMEVDFSLQFTCICSILVTFNLRGTAVTVNTLKTLDSSLTVHSASCIMTASLKNGLA